jgi:hypothetical protein
VWLAYDWVAHLAPARAVEKVATRAGQTDEHSAGSKAACWAECSDAPRVGSTDTTMAAQMDND